MKTDPSCDFVQLASAECCEIIICRHCRVIHLRLGPVSLKLPVEVLGQLSQSAHKAMANYQALVSADNFSSLPQTETLGLKPIRH